MRKALIIPAVMVVLLVGCRPEENREQLKAVNRSLEFANGVLNDVNTLGYEELMAWESDMVVAFYAEKWKIKAKQMKLMADSVKDLLKMIKSDLITQSDSLKKGHVPVVKQLYNMNGLGNRLLNKLIVFKDSCPALICSGADTLTRTVLKNGLNNYLNTAPLLLKYADSFPEKQQHDYKEKWLEEKFGSGSSLMAMVMLNEIENDVLTMEKHFIGYCQSQRSREIVETYSKVSAVATLSSSYVKVGQPIEVTAGVGQFTDAMKNRITINGKEVALNDEGVAQYKFVAFGKPGTHTIPVTFEFTKLDGSTEFIKKNAKYIIAEK